MKTGLTAIQDFVLIKTKNFSRKNNSANRFSCHLYSSNRRVREKWLYIFHDMASDFIKIENPVIRAKLKFAERHLFQNKHFGLVAQSAWALLFIGINKLIKMLGEVVTDIILPNITLMFEGMCAKQLNKKLINQIPNWNSSRTEFIFYRQWISWTSKASSWENTRTS